MILLVLWISQTLTAWQRPKQKKQIQDQFLPVLVWVKINAEAVAGAHLHWSGEWEGCAAPSTVTCSTEPAGGRQPPPLGAARCQRRTQVSVCLCKKRFVWVAGLLR